MMNLLQWAEFMSYRLAEFSDLEFQIQVWIRGKGPKVSSLDEATNLFFDHLEGFLELPEIESNKILHNSIKLFCTALGKVTNDIMDDKKMTIEFLMSPLWISITQLAKNAKNELDKARKNWQERIVT